MTAEAIRRGYTSSKQAGDGRWKQNCSRDTWRWFNRWGFRWNVKLSTYDYIAPSGEVITMTYISPCDLMAFLIEKYPSILVGGLQCPTERAQNLRTFWDGFKLQHADHKNTPTTCKISSRSLGTATRGVANDVAIQWWYHVRQSSDFIQFCRKGRGVQHVSVTLRSPFKTNFQGRMLMTDYLLNRCQFCWIRGRT